MREQIGEPESGQAVRSLRSSVFFPVPVTSIHCLPDTMTRIFRLVACLLTAQIPNAHFSSQQTWRPVRAVVTLAATASFIRPLKLSRPAIIRQTRLRTLRCRSPGTVQTAETLAHSPRQLAQGSLFVARGNASPAALCIFVQQVVLFRYSLSSSACC